MLCNCVHKTTIPPPRDVAARLGPIDCDTSNMEIYLSDSISTLGDLPTCGPIAIPFGWCSLID